MKADVLVLGAGMVGVSAALHLQARGRDVVLVDRHAAAGEETSYGNAGLIEQSSVIPYMFPRQTVALLRYALNRAPEAHYHWRALPTVLPWLARYFLRSGEAATMRSAAALLPLITRSLDEHEPLMQAADATHLMRKVGWLKLFRTEALMRKGEREADRVRAFGIPIDTLAAQALLEREPQLIGAFAGATHWRDTASVTDPGALVKAYAALFVKNGGRLVAGDARTLTESGGAWRVATPANGTGAVEAGQVVLSLGPWSNDVFRAFGYRFPLGIKRGYHLHFKPHGNAVLNYPVYDAEGAYVLAPMARGIRLTTGAEFALREAPPTPVQIAKTRRFAEHLFPLGDPVEATPWLGRRPCLPDMLPVVGPAPRHKGLWFDFGHQHFGFTLGPVTGRLLAEMVTGETPFTDPEPYAAERFH